MLFIYARLSALSCFLTSFSTTFAEAIRFCCRIFAWFMSCLRPVHVPRQKHSIVEIADQGAARVNNHALKLRENNLIAFSINLLVGQWAV